MEAFDFLVEQVVMSPAGPVALSLARHEDGAVSVIAWSLTTGERVGYASRRARGRLPSERLIDPALADTVVASRMAMLLAGATDGPPPPEAIGRQLVNAGRLTEGDVSDLLGWQWLMAELGQPRQFGELALAAGLISQETLEVVGWPVIRRAGRLEVLAPAMSDNEELPVPA